MREDKRALISDEARANGRSLSLNRTMHVLCSTLQHSPTLVTTRFRVCTDACALSAVLLAASHLALESV
eukprot:104303-Pleurochrysis_carterae.AAC.2